MILKPSTLLYFHRALVKRKYRLLYSPRKRRRPGPKGPSKELIDAVVEMKRRNPRFGCRKMPSKSPARSVSISIRMSSDAYSSSTTDRCQVVTVLRGSASLGTPGTACGASTCFAANQFCSGATGSWS